MSLEDESCYSCPHDHIVNGAMDGFFCADERGGDRFETRHLRKDGSLIDVEVQVTIQQMGGKWRFLGYVHDISQRNAEKAALIRARDEAERANQSKSKFLSRMSHELRTPLNAVLGFGELLESDRDELLSETQRDNVEEILQAGRHLLKMIDEVLDVSRLEAGQFEIHLEAVDIAPIIERAVGQLQPVANRRDITIENEVNTAPRVQADHTRVEQVLVNLLSNAVTYTGDGGTVRLLCSVVNGDRLHISLAVSDSEIQPETLEGLFQIFGHVDSTYAGSGVGLALSKSLIETDYAEERA
ncbi:MAG: PAS domain-containing sensor histidine kinase [Spirochaetota bacterium]